jgi:hypothetical protein
MLVQTLGFVLCWVCVGMVQQDGDTVFSGPQVGEKLEPFSVTGVLGSTAGKEIDFVTEAAGKPIVLIFVHDINRQSVSMTRILSAYTASRSADGLHTGIVYLADDATEAEETIKRIKHALTPEAPIGISPDGREGPGSYGLNRNVMLTILVGKENKVTANYALVQPSLKVDLPKIVEQIIAVAGGEMPDMDKLVPSGGMAATGRPTETKPAQDVLPREFDPRSLLRLVIRKQATPEQVDAAAAKVELAAANDENVKREIGRIANTVMKSGKLKEYGTETARKYLEKWAKEYGEGNENADEKKPDRDQSK